MFHTSFAERTGRLAFEIADQKILPGPEYLTEMIVPVTSDPQSAGFQLQKGTESIQNPRLIVYHPSTLLFRLRRQTVESLLEKRTGLRSQSAHGIIARP